MAAPSDTPIRLTEAGLYCAAGDFYVDPWKRVERAVITHAHADHARPGMGRYLTAEPGRRVLQERMPAQARIDTLRFGETRTIGDVKLSLHPAGHLLGSAQVRIEVGGRVLVISGDYKTAPDRTCDDFEPVRCHEFITESTFGLPIYRWPTQQAIFDGINAWWRRSRDQGRSCVVFAYSLGKAQRVLSGLDPSIGPILLHGAVDKMTTIYREQGLPMPPTRYADPQAAKQTRGQALVVAPPASAGTPWMRKFGEVNTAFASGWMLVRGMRRWRALDRGFPLSDHVDWDGLLQTIEATGAERIGVTHGYVDTVVRWLQEQGRDAWAVPTRFSGEGDGGETTQAAQTTQTTQTTQQATQATQATQAMQAMAAKRWVTPKQD